MNDASSLRPYAIALIASTILWTMTASLTRRVEPWDAGAYWTIAYPLAIVLAGVLGYRFPQRPWRWAVVIIFTQVLVMFARGAGFGLLPLGVILLAVLCLPAVAVARLGARARLRKQGAANTTEAR